MKKSTKNEKFNRAFNDIDYARLISDLKRTEMFTDTDIAQSLKTQKKGITVNVNYVFYSNVVQPLIEKLGDLMSVKKLGGTRFYTILDRQKALEVFKKPEKKAETPLPMVLPRPVAVDPIPGPTAEEPKAFELEKPKQESSLTKEKLDRAFRLSPKNMYGFKKRLLGMIVVYGCMYRNNEPKTLSSIPKNILKNYYSSASYNLDKLVAEFNTAVRILDYPYVTKNSGVKRSHRFSVDVSPRKILKLLKEIGCIYFEGDKEVKLFLDWSFNKVEDLGVKQNEKPASAPKAERAKKEKSPKPESLPVNYSKEEATKEVSEEITAWIITKMDCKEFETRYGLRTPKTLMKDNQGSYVFEVSVSNEETLKRIKSELRIGEYIKI